MAPILFHGLSQLSLPVVCVESRQPTRRWLAEVAAGRGPGPRPLAWPHWREVTAFSLSIWHRPKLAKAAYDPLGFVL